MSNPLVSVIIACYNGEKSIEKCISSIEQQTYKEVEILVCDDGSSDKSFDVLKKLSDVYSNINILKNEHSLRAAASRNRCLELAKGKYIAIQDADDFSNFDRIEKQVNFLENNKQFDFVSSDAYLFSDDTYCSYGIMQMKKDYPEAKDFLWGIPFIHPATMFTADCIRNVKGYRVAEETKRGQDYDMFMRMYAKGFKGANIRENLYWYRVDDSCVKRHALSSAKDEVKVRVKGFKALKLMPIGYLFALKPYIANLAHRFGYFSHKAK